MYCGLSLLLDARKTYISFSIQISLAESDLIRLDLYVRVKNVVDQRKSKTLVGVWCEMVNICSAIPISTLGNAAVSVVHRTQKYLDTAGQ